MCFPLSQLCFLGWKVMEMVMGAMTCPSKLFWCYITAWRPGRALKEKQDRIKCCWLLLMELFLVDPHC